MRATLEGAPDRPPSSSRAHSLPVTQHSGPVRQRIRPGGLARSPDTWFVGPTPAVCCRLNNTFRRGCPDRGRRRSGLPAHGRRVDSPIADPAGREIPPVACPTPARLGAVRRPHRLEAQDATLSRWRSGVRIPLGAPPPGAPRPRHRRHDTRAWPRRTPWEKRPRPAPAARACAPRLSPGVRAGAESSPRAVTRLPTHRGCCTRGPDLGRGRGIAREVNATRSSTGPGSSQAASIGRPRPARVGSFPHGTLSLVALGSRLGRQPGALLPREPGHAPDEGGEC